MDFIWEEAGISLHFPHANYKEEIRISISIATNADELGILPPQYRFMPAASATYKITASNILPTPARIRIKHCANLDQENSLILMVARNEPPYWFKPLKEGELSLGSDYGETNIKQFSLFRFMWNLLFYRLVNLSVHIFYHNDSEATFVVTKNLPAHVTAVEQTIAHTNVEDITMSCASTTEAIVLSLPATSEGWHVTSKFEPAEIKTLDIDTYEPGMSCPKIILCMEWKGRGNPKEENVSIPITGGSLNSFTLLCKPKHHKNEAVRIQSEQTKLLPRIPQLDNLPHFSRQPTLPWLHTFPTSFGNVRIIERIGVHYHHLSILLLNDATGAITAAIEAMYRDQNRITEAILQKWLEGTGRAPQTWATLITVLREIELNVLAKEIEDNMLGQDTDALLESPEKQVKR